MSLSRVLSVAIDITEVSLSAGLTGCISPVNTIAGVLGLRGRGREREEERAKGREGRRGGEREGGRCGEGGAEREVGRE